MLPEIFKYKQCAIKLCHLKMKTFNLEIQIFLLEKIKKGKILLKVAKIILSFMQELIIKIENNIYL